MRDLNEHHVECFIDVNKGRFPEKWVHVTDDVIADASSIVNNRIGNWLDWDEVAAAAEKLIAALPQELPGHV